MNLPKSFHHLPPEGYSYVVEKFDAKHLRIGLHHHRTYDYNNGQQVYTVWGFYNPKTDNYYSPVNAKKVGKVVDISSTRNYTAMPIKQTPLESAFDD